MKTQLVWLAILSLLSLAACSGPDHVETPEPAVTEAEVFDAARAADVSAFRWQAMARFYEENDMLTRDPFDYNLAADNLAFRWQAMAKFYEEHGMLTRDPGTTRP